jgi:hypothetical protein
LGNFAGGRVCFVSFVVLVVLVVLFLGVGPDSGASAVASATTELACSCGRGASVGPTVAIVVIAYTHRTKASLRKGHLDHVRTALEATTMCEGMCKVVCPWPSMVGPNMMRVLMRL